MKMKKILAIVLSAIMIVGSMAVVSAEGTTVEVSTNAEFISALDTVSNVKIKDNFTVDTKVTVPDGTTIDLNGKALYWNVENSYFGTSTIRNGNIVFGKDDVHVCDGYFLVNEGKTLTIDGVEITSSAADGMKCYAVFHLKTGAAVDIKNSTINVAKNEHKGYVVYAGEATAKADFTDSTVNTEDVAGVVHAATTIKSSSFTVKGTEGTAMEHGINRSAVTITDSEVTISGGTGRGITPTHGPLVINGNSTVKIYDMAEASIELRSNQTVTVAETASVLVDKAITAEEGTTVTVNGTVTVDENLAEIANAVAKVGENYYSDIQEAINAAVASNTENIVVELLNDAVLDITAWDTLAIGGENTKSITINGNYKTLTFNKQNSDWNHIATNNNAKLILNDMTITDSGYNNGPWNRYDLNFACDVELNNVTATKALAFKSDATLKNVEINEVGDNYAIWITSGGQNVTIDGLKITSAGRGIKIDEQYQTAPSKVELSVKNATFATEKKAAILVKSAAGADVEVENVDITNVKADSVNAVWVDSDSSVHYGKVTVTGANVAVEGAEDFVALVASQGKVEGYYTTLAEAIDKANKGDTVTIKEGTYPLPTMKAGITVVGEGKVILEGTLTGTLEDLTMKNLHIKGSNAQRWAYAKGNLLFENVTFEATSVYALHFDGITEGATLLYKNCTIIGWAAMSGSPESCVFDGCTIKDNGRYGVVRTYFDAEIKNCTFDVGGANTEDVYQDGIHAVDATVKVNNCTNVNGDIKDILDISDDAYIYVDDVLVLAPTVVNWGTDTDAGYYMDGTTKYGMMRFLFASDVVAEDVISSGIKYIKASDITDAVNATGITVTGSSAAFYGDIIEIPEESAGTYIAVAYVTTKYGTFWSETVECITNFENDYSGYKAQ